MRAVLAGAALLLVAGCANGGGPLTSPSPVGVVTPTVPTNCTVPSVPGELSAEVTGASVSLSWSAVEDATDYVVEVGWTPATSETVLTNTAEAHHWIESIAPGTHFARVHAHNWCGTSDPSNTIAFSVQSSDQ